MKLGNAEGSPQEIRELLERNGSRLEDFLVLEKPDKPLGTIWIVLPVLAVFGAVFFLVLSETIAPRLLILTFLIGSGGAIWASVSIQIRFKNLWATAVVGIGLFLLVLVAAGYLGPKDVLDTIKGLRNEKS